MSGVFVVEDRLLHREVMVKLLPPDLMAKSSVEPFRPEMRPAPLHSGNDRQVHSRLSFPHDDD